MLNSTTPAKVGFAEYERFVNDTAIYRDTVYPILGLNGECGEFTELVKKAWREHGGDWVSFIDRDKAKSELGDILWYVSRIAATLDLKLEAVVATNIEKLTNRSKYGKEKQT